MSVRNLPGASHRKAGEGVRRTSTIVAIVLATLLAVSGAHLLELSRSQRLTVRTGQQKLLRSPSHCGISPHDDREEFRLLRCLFAEAAKEDEEFVEEEPLDEEQVLKMEAARKEAKNAKRKLSVASHLGKIKIKPSSNPSSASSLMDLANSLKGVKKERGASKRAMEREKGFFHELQKDKAVRRLPSGVMFKVLSKGKGARSPMVDPYGSGEFVGVTVKYSARFAVGRDKGFEFDNSEMLAEAKATAMKRDRTKLGKFLSPLDPTSGKIKGVAEALQLMREGDKWEVFVPAAFGFGDDGVDDVVPPYMTLAYTIELQEVLEGLGSKDADDNEAVFLRHWGLEYSEL